MHKEFTEKDWKLFRQKVILWQERYMERLKEEYIQILKQDKNASEKFWELEKRIKQDKKKPGVQMDMRRATMIMNIISLLNDEVIEPKDLEEFSEEVKDTIRRLQR